MKYVFSWLLALLLISQSGPLLASNFNIISRKEREAKRQEEVKSIQERFNWWPTDAAPEPVKDEKKSGYWWWPSQPGEASPWGNRGYIYLYKIIFDYKAEELPPPQPKELRPSLVIKKVIKNVKIYFDYDKADLRDDHLLILEEAVRSLKRNPEADILIAGNCDKRGSGVYNQKLGAQRAAAVKNFMIKKSIPEYRIRIISKGKLDAIAPVTDLVGMQKDRNAQFMIAEVEEVMIPYDGGSGMPGEGEPEDVEYIEEEDINIESEVKVSTREYVVKKNDTLKKIAQEQLGGAHRWKHLYEFNKERIENPDSLEAGVVLVIPVEQEEQKKTPQVVNVPPAVERAYVISKDDSLWKIAKKQLGNGKRWKEIYELNKDKIKNPDKLKAGQKIIIPAK